MSIFSDRLKFLRNEKNITQSELARAINRSRATIAGYEIDDRMPDIDTLTKIADYFDEDVDWILGRTNTRSRSMSHGEAPVSREAFRLLAEMGLAELTPNSRGELIVNMSKENLHKIFDDEQTRLDFLDSALSKTLDLFSLPIEAKEDLGKAIMSIALKYNAFTPPSE